MADRRKRLRKGGMERETNSGEGVKAEGRESKINTERLARQTQTLGWQPWG